jgi:hypothetical protein
MLTTSLLIGLLIAGLLAFTAYELRREPPPTPIDPMDARYGRLFPHDAPASTFSLAQAHQAMLTHRTCDRRECPRKNAAWTVLVDAGYFTPAQGAW